jgi:hypothetical protein
MKILAGRDFAGYLFAIERQDMKKKLAAGLLAGLLGAAASAHADVIATFTGVNAERDIHISINDTYSNPSISGNEFVATGNYQWSGDASNPIGLQGNFSTFCIDFTQDIDFNKPPYTFQVASLDGAPSDLPVYHDPLLAGNGMGTERANAVRELWGLNHSSLDNADKVAGFQLAIWKILYEPTITQNPATSMDITTGNLRTTDSGAFVNYADQYLASIVSNGHYRTDHLATDLYALTNDRFQDQIVEFSGPPTPQREPSPVPAPKSVYAGVALMAGLGWMKRKKVARV